ncbi:MAG: Flp pilus assembly protein CpaB [Bradyrhizobiaceae bacterium]|nr:Flp pilus assembly protein CpaB [Bradyrhizobiaceae bacterium]
MNSVATLVLAIVMGGVAAFLARQWLEIHSQTSTAAKPTAAIVVAKTPLAFGTELSADNVVEMPWAAASLPDGAFASVQDLLKDGRRVVLAALERNEPVLSSKVTAPGQRGSLSSLLQEGNRAVTVRVDDVRGVAGFILPGDFVDVVLIRAEEGLRRENYSEILLQQVKVLAVDQLASERQEQPTVAKAVTLEVTPEQAQKVLLATNIGKLSLILRQPGEKNAPLNRRITEGDLGVGPPKPIPAPVVAPPPETVAPAPPPPPRLETATVAVIRGTKREEYSVRREDMSSTESDDPEERAQTNPAQHDAAPRAGSARKGKSN